ncbi:MAG TPA: hypothetical protein DEO40_00680 [Treponema sp.]|jgi:hypothetical protein|nr:PQ-loop repeat-containing protein [Treponema sp.]HCA19176.1 hypothetical protein [Treponema sp.]
MLSSILETVMLICFGLSWPLNVIKNYKSKSAEAMSLPFILLVITGYIAGIVAKILNGHFNFVLAVYVINLLIVSVNIPIYFRNKKIETDKYETIRFEIIKNSDLPYEAVFGHKPYWNKDQIEQFKNK